MSVSNGSQGPKEKSRVPKLKALPAPPVATAASAAPQAAVAAPAPVAVATQNAPSDVAAVTDPSSQNEQDVKSPPRFTNNIIYLCAILIFDSN